MRSLSRFVQLIHSLMPMILGCGMYEKCMWPERLAPDGVQALADIHELLDVYLKA